MKKFLFILLLALIWGQGRANAQDFALKSNILYWGTTTPNLGAEFGLGRKTSVQIEAGYNPWTFNKSENRKIKHVLVMPEFRWWFCITKKMARTTHATSEAFPRCTAQTATPT